jgi:16S rRNA (cytidine1402-2'-O)-methyltransferase
MLSLVATPIGNLKDITLRAIETLKSADLIVAEDTRTTGHLLKHFEIHTPMRSFHAHNEHSLVDQLVQSMRQGDHIALVSDAGTPGISDPGFLLARACIENDLEVEVIPGPTAFVPALLLSGMPIHEFIFCGFLPLKKGRKKRLEEIATYNQTLVLYESPHRIIKTLEQILLYLGDREMSISREITKKFEETVRGKASELLAHFRSNTPKGEFVLVIGPVNPSSVEAPSRDS